MMRRPHNHIYHEIVTSPLLCGYRDARPVCLLASAVPGSRTRCAPGTVARSARELASTSGTSKTAAPTPDGQRRCKSSSMGCSAPAKMPAPMIGLQRESGAPHRPQVATKPKASPRAR